jgi:hypothetical protein
MVLVVNKPTYSKLDNEPCHTFRIETDQTLSGVYDASHPHTPLEVLNSIMAEQSSAVVSFLKDFLEATIKYFAKAYTADAVGKLLKHEVRAPTDDLSSPAQVVCTPVEMLISKGSFRLIWTLTQEPLLIAIPEDAPAPKPAVEHPTGDANSLWVKQPYNFATSGNVLLQSTDVDALPMDDSSDMVELQGSSPRHIVDRQRVKEAALRAKLAAMKAERAQYEYMEKYGEDVSDSSETESDDSDSE